MADFKISRLKYTWRGTWATATAYNKDDIIRYGGKSYVCIRQHTSTGFYAEQNYKPIGYTDLQPAWEIMTDGFDWKGAWTASTLWKVGDLVLYGGVLYICIEEHIGTQQFLQNVDKWHTYSSQIKWEGEWADITRYGVGAVVRYNGIVYRCIEEHSSAPTITDAQTGEVTSYPGLEADIEKWEVLFEGIEFKGDWLTGVRYRPNDLVLYGGSLWRCKEGHISGADSTIVFDEAEHWELEASGFQFSEEWDAGITYQQGDVVRHGGYLFYALTTNYNSSPGTSIYQIEDRQDPVDWAIISKGINFRGEWAASELYKTGDVVRRGGHVYVALLDTTADGSSLDYLDAGSWELIITGKNWRNFWEENKNYAVGDVVSFIGNAYECTVEHESSTQNYPGDNGSGYNFWNLLLQAGPNVGMRQRGDMLTWDLSRPLANDGSTFGPTALTIGNEGEVLSIDDVDSLEYRVFGTTTRNFFVSTATGVDDEDPLRGVNIHKPFKTIRAAAEKADDGFEGFTNIRIATGIYEEVLPIIVPARTSLVGTRGNGDTRSAQVRPKPANPNLAGDVNFTADTLTHLGTLLSDIALGVQITPTVGNTEPQVFPAVGEAGSSLATDDITALITDIKDYIFFYISSSGVAPEVVGTNELTTDQDYIKTAAIILANREFLAAEAVAWMRLTYPSYTFDGESCKRDVRKYVDAWVYDIQYTGNYKSLLAARYYKNAVLGSEGEDMFYVRDATVVRNMTVAGLTGTLNPPLVDEIYRRPTGGAYVSLDPGWGPDDDRTWINTRSPYVQNVTTFGYAAIGAKVDGSIHNGGNKSMVANDFTQVISDGVGAWVLNGGRVELVSVFTYYSQIGYFAENGGIIRATNGNNSYGDYGSVANGVDPTETPAYGYVNTRSGQAIVAAAFAGEVNDEILAFEFTNAGQNYTTATYTTIGSGVGVNVVQEEIRDNAVFDVRIITPPDSGRPGGGGYSLIGNNAQTGDDYTLTIASNDLNERSELLGLRVVITSGPGTGQYGYVYDYDFDNKLVTVYRESDGQPGWDNIVAGTPNVVPLTTQSFYRFEPRPIFSKPQTLISQKTLPLTSNWLDIVYGETTDSYTAVEGSIGSGTTIDVVPVTSTWDVIKNGRTYLVTLNNPGAGYQFGQTVTISGDDVGGVTPDNDIRIKITGVSDDSTNSIIGFEASGVAASGKFIATATGVNTGAYSDNGVDWSQMTMPTAGNWRVAAGLNKFVAVKENSNSAAYSLDGISWTAVSLPASRQWVSVAYGGGVFLAIASNLNSAAYSTNGTTWTAVSIPTAGDSTFNEWIDVAYGKGQFVILANSNNLVANMIYNSETNTWTSDFHIMDVVADSSQKDWKSIAYGNNRFVAISTTADIAYSFNGEIWYPGTMPSPDGSTRMHWNSISYGQGVFLALCDTAGQTIGAEPTTGPTNYAVVSYDGLVWEQITLTREQTWTAAAFGTPDVYAGDSTLGNTSGMWIAISSDSTNYCNQIFTGAKAIGRCIVEAGQITEIRLWEPGSGYLEPPTLTVNDPNATSMVYVENRIADGVLAQPSFISRGLGYKTSNTTVRVNGDGFADVIPVGKFVVIDGLTTIPGPGTQLRFGGRTKPYTAVLTQDESQSSDGKYSATFRVTPEFSVDDYIEDDMEVEIRERYSQCRITGHDFLDVGTGNFEQSNYPDLYFTGDFVSAPENEVYEVNGGRVFYTSTDQSGNFRAGELFAVEQATGIVTISADFFDLNGLTELRLGGIRFGSGVVIREFSTDPLFTADSNNVVPTQRAIKAYLTNRLTVGGSELSTASFIAGTVKVGPGVIDSTVDGIIDVPVPVNFDGTARISGAWLAEMMFHRKGF